MASAKKCFTSQIQISSVCNKPEVDNLSDWLTMHLMLRSFVSYLFIISLLFMGIESMVDPVTDDHLHGDASTHFSDNDNSISTDSEDNSDHCQHCCHGHTSCFSEPLIAISDDAISQQISFYNLQLTSFAQAPPTPPPNV